MTDLLEPHTVDPATEAPFLVMELLPGGNLSWVCLYPRDADGTVVCARPAVCHAARPRLTLCRAGSM